MPVGQSILPAGAVGTFVGLLCGQLAGEAVKRNGGGEVWKRLATFGAHAAGAAAAGWTVNALMLADVTGAAVTPVASATTAAAHGLVGRDAFQGMFFGADSGGTSGADTAQTQTSTPTESKTTAFPDGTTVDHAKTDALGYKYPDTESYNQGVNKHTITPGTSGGPNVAYPAT